MSPVLAPPRVVLDVDGERLDAAQAGSLSTVLVRQVLSAPSVCELGFVDPPAAGELAGRLAPGTSVRVGLDDSDLALFVGEVTAVEHVFEPGHGRELRVRAYDALHRLRKRQSPRVRVQVTPRDLAAELVADVGLTVEASESGPTWPRLIQHRQSDLELLLDVCERSGLYLAVDGATLRLLTLEGDGDPVPLALGETLLEASVEANGEPATRQVTAVGWDPARIETHTGTADTARVGRRIAASVEPDAVGGTGERTLLDEAAIDDGQASALAQAELDRRIAREVVFRGIANGDPRLRAGRPVEISNVDPGVDGRYVLTEVRHTIDRAGGFRSELSTEPPEPAGRPWAATVTAGTVRSADDPDGLGRVQVSLPSFGEVETPWLGVVTVGAGSGKGIIALPDAGDQVLVLLANEDPSRGIVLGGLYGASGPPDSGVVGGSVKRYSFLTSGGHSIKLDDEQHSIRVEDSQGSYVELAPDLVKIHAVSDLEIEAPGHAIKIRGSSVDFETG
jgi:phage baseplate assembly protein V